jgi:hypothetical protein
MRVIERYWSRGVVARIGFAALALCGGAYGSESEQQAMKLFSDSVYPILRDACFECHNKGDRSKGGLRLTSREALIRGGDRGPAIDLNDPDKSLLIQALGHDPDCDVHMPPKGKLADAVIHDFRRWVRLGAPWPPARTAPDGPWYLQPLRVPEPPAGFPEAESSVDAFIGARLASVGLKPAPPADKRTLLRRVTFDLIGLPPTPEEVAAFLADESPDAFAKVVERLLASPHYGERWARHWLDLVRYAETNGFEYDHDKWNAYRYRDYVIDAFNRDLPYDQFVREQIAGDLAEDPRVSDDGSRVMSSIGTTFLWLGERAQVQLDRATLQADEIENQIDVFGKTFLGLTLACARCHDHKFDPITLEDYYALAGILTSSAHGQRCVDSRSRRDEIAVYRRQLSAIDRRINALLAKADRSQAMADFRRSQARQISRYLAACRELIRMGDGLQKQDIHAVAGKHNLSGDKLTAWLEHVQGAFAREDRVWGPWELLSRCSPRVFAYRAQSAAARMQSASHPTSIPGGVPFSDFEGSSYGDWVATGPAFGSGPEAAPPYGVSGHQGRQFASSYGGSDRFVGRLLSPPFKVDESHRYVTFLIAGGDLPEKTCVNLVVDGEAKPDFPEFTATGANDGVFRRRVFDLKGYTGVEASIEVVDDAEGPGGHILVDDFRFISDIPLAQPSSANAVIASLLDGPACRSPAELDAAYQEAIWSAVESWQQQVEQYRGEETVRDDEREVLCEWTNCLSDPSREELRSWAMRGDSLIGTTSDAEQFLSTQEQEELGQLRGEKADLEARIPSSTSALIALEGTPKDSHVHLRGNAHDLGDLVPRAVPSLFGGSTPIPGESSGRRELANWLTGAASPLLARVIVNRLWLHHFGRGLVSTPDNFGELGEPPSHPELLDYLASRLIESNWSLKTMHRLMLNSGTYKQSNQTDAAALDVDPDNRLWHHMPIRRLEAECVRDAILEVAGGLDHSLYGPSVRTTRGRRPHLEVNRKIPQTDAIQRRSIYLQIRRNALPPLLTVFDFPKPDTCMGTRSDAPLPLQALALLNDEFVSAQAGHWVSRLPIGGSTWQRIEYMYQRALCRPPSIEELQTSADFVARQKQHYAELGKDDIRCETMAWSDFAHVLFNLAEFTFVR